MLRRRNVFFALFFLAGLSMLSLQNAYAEANSSENSLTGFFRRLFNYPVKATQKTGEMTANTLNNTGDKVLSQTGEKLSQGKPEGLVQPVVGAAQTTGQTAAETVQIPVKAAEEEKK